MIGDLERILLAPGGAQTSAWRWGTVTAANPLQVRLDGEATTLPAIVQSLVSDLRVGDRVWVQIAGRRLVVHGSNRPSATGAFAGTTDGIGYLTVTHGLPFTPSAVAANPSGPPTLGADFVMLFLTDTFTATTFRVRALGNLNSVTMSAMANFAVTGLWVAL